MAESEAYRKGSEMRRKLLGDAYVERANKTTYDDPTTRKFISVVTETVFGTLWTRPGLDLKTRTLVCVVSDAATGRRQSWTSTGMALRQAGPRMSGRSASPPVGLLGAPRVREPSCRQALFAESRRGTSRGREHLPSACRRRRAEDQRRKALEEGARTSGAPNGRTTAAANDSSSTR